jgi:hypothetical protein
VTNETKHVIRECAVGDTLRDDQASDSGKPRPAGFREETPRLLRGFVEFLLIAAAGLIGIGVIQYLYE